MSGEVKAVGLQKLGAGGLTRRCNRCLFSPFIEAIEALPLANTPEVFGLHPNAEIGYYTQAARDMWAHLLELQPQTGKVPCRQLCSWGTKGVGPKCAALVSGSFHIAGAFHRRRWIPWSHAQVTCCL